jgi:ribonuclease P protein component
VRLGNAVLRNRLRRRLREVFRLNRANLPGGWDFLVNPREAVGKVSFPTLQRELLRLFPQQPPSPPPQAGS